MGLEPLQPRNKADIQAVVDLHRAYLADSPAVMLGDRFLRDFFYSKLVEDELIGCTICRADEQVVGFISYTKYPHDFMGRAIRKRFLYLSWVMALSVLARPAMIRDILFTLRMMRERKDEADETPAVKMGEVISITTLPDYRNYVPPGGTSRLSIRLFESMVDYFEADDFDAVWLLVQPSNMASNLFCSSMGCSFEKVEHAGSTVHRYTYPLNDLEAETPG